LDLGDDQFVVQADFHEGKDVVVPKGLLGPRAILLVLQRNHGHCTNRSKYLSAAMRTLGDQ
jgi:hypothetical protein